MSVIHVQTPGLLTTVQDRGREGFGTLGISPSGAADPISLQLGNRLVANPESAAGLEMTLLGGIFHFPGDRCRITDRFRFRRDSRRCSRRTLDVRGRAAGPNASPGCHAYRSALLLMRSGRNCCEALSWERVDTHPKWHRWSPGKATPKRRRSGDSVLDSALPQENHCPTGAGSLISLWHATRHAWTTAGLVPRIVPARLPYGHLSYRRAIQSHGPSSRRRARITERYRADDYRRRFSGRRAGATGRLAHHSFR